MLNWHDAIDRGDQDLPAAQRQRLVRRLEIGIADGVVDDVGALAEVSSRTRAATSVAGSIDHLDRRIGVAFICFGLAHHADDARAAPGRDLHGGLADLAVDAHHEHGFVRLRQAGAAQAFHRRDKGHADAGGLFPGNRLWVSPPRLRARPPDAWHGCRRGGCRDRRRSRTPRARSSRGAVDDNAGIVAAGRARKDGIGHQAGGSLHVGRIDRRRLHLDQQFVAACASVCAARRPAPVAAGSSAFASKRTQRASTVRGGSSRLRGQPSSQDKSSRSSHEWRDTAYPFGRLS